MPKPIVCLSEVLRQFAERFRGCFTKRQWKYFVTVLLGLSECEERRTLSGLLRVVGERVSLSGLSRFLSRWPWATTAVSQVWLGHFRARLEPLVQDTHQRLCAARPQRRGRPQRTVVTGYLVFDDSVQVKPQGRKMGGLGQHYAATERRVVSGHGLFSGFYVLLGQRCPLAPRLYRQRKVCEQAGEPFRSKIELAVEEIEHFAPVAGTHTHVLVDSWYHCKQVRRAARQRHWDLSGGLKSNRRMRLIGDDGGREWLTLAQYAQRLSSSDWQEVLWPSAQGGQTIYAHLCCTWVRKLGPTLLLITCHDPSAPPQSRRSWGSTDLNLGAQELVNILAIRWEIETYFEYQKDLLGSDHYQVMTCQAIVRFWTLTACFLCFLEEQRAQQEHPPTCGEVRRTIQEEQRRNLLGWLETQYRAGLTAEQISRQLAA